MRSRFELLLLLALVVLAPIPSAAQPQSPQRAEAPTREEVRKALDKVGNDPNLAAERTVSMLRWAEREAATEEPWWWQSVNALARWFRGLFEWLAASGRYLVWVLGGFLAGLLLVYVVRLLRQRGVPRLPPRFVAPSHVRDLDIRPESLPRDVGAAALALWRSGEQRAALALLYRGMLSRLVHDHGVPIRASATEGECLALAQPWLTAPSASYAAQLVATWTAAVYGGLAPAPRAVETLCGEFARALDRSGEAAA